MEKLKERPEITNLIRKVSEEQGINNYTITDVKTNQKGEGYLGEIFMVTVKDARNGRQLDMVIKAAFIDEKVREMVPIRMSFENEIYFYSDVIPLFRKFEKDHGITQTVQLAPKCLMVSTEDQAEMLALENLRVLGFDVFDKKLSLDHDHVKLIFKTYGRFHAYSFALRDQLPEEYSKIASGLYNVYGEFMKKRFFGDHLVEVNKLVEKCLIPEEDDDLIKKYEKYSGRKVADIFDDVVTKTVDYSVITHGDCWSNNMMFRYEDLENRKKPTDMRLIDWQLIKAGSPVCDLSYCLYSGASKKILDNLNEYLNIYYESFSSFLRELGSNPEKLFPFAVLKEHWRKYSKFGMIMSFAILRMKMTDKEDIVDLTDGLDMDELGSVFLNSKFSEDEFNTRIRGLLRHMDEIDAL